ncbi:hypothetical protein, partial [Aeromonas caviae]|uniref:hypothetical protein n=1 Tax=Aeromonas caviae TaxID=648 RepID=UPI0035A21C3D
LAFRVLVKAADPDVADAVPLHDVSLVEGGLSALSVPFVVFRRRLHEISGVGCTARTGRLQGSVESGFSYLEAC